MAFNNGFPVTYQPYYTNPQMQTPVNPAAWIQNNNDPIIWVQGLAGAKSYLVAPNTTVRLWDSEANTIYIKSADASGMPSIKILDYTVREEQPKAVHQVQPDGNYVTVEAFKEEINRIEDEIKKLAGGAANE